jgi:hypothetical protein
MIYFSLIVIMNDNLKKKNIYLLKNGKQKRGQIKVRFHFISFDYLSTVTLNVRICIGFNVTVVACDDISSKKSKILRLKNDFLFVELTGNFHLV